MDAWGMEKNYYSFDAAGFHFIVLDCNYVKQGNSFLEYANGNYCHCDDKLAANGSINWPDMHDLAVFSERHFQRDHDRRIIKWPPVQKGAIMRPRVQRSEWIVSRQSRPRGYVYIPGKGEEGYADNTWISKSSLQTLDRRSSFHSSVPGTIWTRRRFPRLC